MKIDTSDIVCIEETAITVRAYRRRTTVPSKIYHLLDLQPEDSLRWVGLKNGTVMITRVPAEESPRRSRNRADGN